MLTELRGVEGPWAGRLALTARPRGGEWLEDEAAGWRRAGVSTVISLLTPEEEADLGLSGEAAAMQSEGMGFRSFPIPDREVPASESGLAANLEQVDGELARGGNVVMHCRQGIGRTGLVAACLLVTKGVDAATAVELLSDARGMEVPETGEQRRWIDKLRRQVRQRPMNEPPLRLLHPATLHILRARGVKVDALPREVVVRR